MTAMDPEELAWRLAAEEPDVPLGEPVSNDTLRAYRQGELAADEREALETRLARDPEVRRRLVRLAEVQPSPPSPELRERVLRSFEEATGRGRRRWLPAVAAAALVALAILVPVLSDRSPDGSTGPLPRELAFEVVVTGLAEARSDPRASATVEAEPETTVRILARATSSMDSPLALAVYRRSPDGLRRVAEAPVEPDRGAAELSVRAADLLGREPGRFQVFVVVARPGDLPARVPLAVEADPETALAENGHRRVYARELVLLPETPP